MFTRAALLLLVAALPGPATAAVASVGASATILEPARLPSQLIRRGEPLDPSTPRVAQFNDASAAQLAQLSDRRVRRGVVIEFE